VNWFQTTGNERTESENTDKIFVIGRLKIKQKPSTWYVYLKIKLEWLSVWQSNKIYHACICR